MILAKRAASYISFGVLLYLIVRKGLVLARLEWARAAGPRAYALHEANSLSPSVSIPTMVSLSLDLLYSEHDRQALAPLSLSLKLVLYRTPLSNFTLRHSDVHAQVTFLTSDNPPSIAIHGQFLYHGRNPTVEGRRGTTRSDCLTSPESYLMSNVALFTPALRPW